MDGMLPTAEPGYATTEFWLSVVTAALVLFGPIAPHLSGEQQAALATLIAVAYTAFRSFRKRGTV